MESETRQIPRGCAWYTYAAVDAPVPSMTRIASDWILWRHRILFIALTFYHPILTSSTIFHSGLQVFRQEILTFWLL